MPPFMFDRNWGRFCRAMGTEQLLTDKRYNTVVITISRQCVLDAAIQAATMGYIQKQPTKQCCPGQYKRNKNYARLAK